MLERALLPELVLPAEFWLVRAELALATVRRRDVIGAACRRCRSRSCGWRGAGASYSETGSLTSLPFGAATTSLDGCAASTNPRAQSIVPRTARRGASPWPGDPVLGIAVGVAPAFPVGIVALVDEACVVITALGDATLICVSGLGLITRVRDRALREHLVPAYTVYRRGQRRGSAGTEGWKGRGPKTDETVRGSPPARLELRAALVALEGCGVALDGSVPHLATTHSAAATAVNAAGPQRAHVEPGVSRNISLEPH